MLFLYFFKQKSSTFCIISKTNCAMFTLPSRRSFHEFQPTTKAAPLLCWDVAHPSLSKKQQIAEDILQLEQLQRQHRWQLPFSFRYLLSNNFTLVITDLEKHILWASQNFEKMTGYHLEEALGQTPSFLQGPDTSVKSRIMVRDKLASWSETETKLLNYRKNGEPYWCQIKIHPLQNHEGVFTHFIAIEKEVDS